MSAVPGFATGSLIFEKKVPGTYQFRTHIEDASDQTTYTGGVWDNIDIGDPDPDRYVIVAIDGSAATRTVTAVTIGGVGASLVSDGSTDARFQGSSQTCEIWIASVPTGTTANISIQWSGAQNRCGVGVWTAYRLLSTQAVDVGGSTAGTGANVLLNSSESGFCIAMHASAASSSYAWTNVTERYDATVENNSGVLRGHSGADAATSGVTITPTAAWTGSNAIRALVAATFALEPGNPGVSRILDSYSNVTGAWSMSRQLLASYGSAALYTTVTGVNQINDQTGNARHLTQGTGSAQPSVYTGYGKTAARMDGSDDYLTESSFTLDELINASDGYVIVCAVVRGVPSPAPNIFAAGSGMRISIQSTTSISMTNRDSSGDKNLGGGGTLPLSLDAVTVFEWRHEGGVLYGRTTKAGASPGSWQSLASGNTTPINGDIVLGVAHLTLGPWAQMDFFEGVTFDGVPNDTLKDALVTDMLTHYG